MQRNRQCLIGRRVGCKVAVLRCVGWKLTMSHALAACSTKLPTYSQCLAAPYGLLDGLPT